LQVLNLKFLLACAKSNKLKYLIYVNYHFNFGIYAVFWDGTGEFRMKKGLIGLLALIVIVAIAATFFVTTKLDDFIAETIRSEGSKALGTIVSVESVATDFKNGSAAISGLSIANPAGYKKATAFSVNNFSTAVDYKNRSISSIKIINPIINAELKGTQNNFKEIVDNIPASEASQEQAKESDSDEPVIQIDEILVTQATVNLVSDVTGEQSFVMNDLKVTNLKGTPSEIAQDITQRLTNHISSEVTKFATELAKAALIQEAKSQVSDKINEAIKGGAIGEKLKGLNFNLR